MKLPSRETHVEAEEARPPGRNPMPRNEYPVPYAALQSISNTGPKRPLKDDMGASYSLVMIEASHKNQGQEHILWRTLCVFVCSEIYAKHRISRRMWTVPSGVVTDPRA